jgi:hypothetical protein
MGQLIPLRADSYCARECMLDARNHTETLAETLLIPWANLRDMLDAEADLMRTRQAANQAAYFERNG